MKFLVYNFLGYILKVFQSLQFRIERVHRALGIKKMNSQLEFDPGHLDAIDFFKILEKEDIGVVFDIGANKGRWSALVKIFFPSATIHAFEPITALGDSFRSFNKTFTNIFLHQIALGSKRELIDFYVTNQIDASSVLQPLVKAEMLYKVKEEEIIKVEQFTLDEYSSMENLPVPDFIKLDVQGYELEVLKGAASNLKLCKYVLMEASFTELYAHQPLFEEIICFMKEHGFRVKFMPISNSNSMIQTDILFKNTSLNSAV